MEDSVESHFFLCIIFRITLRNRKTVFLLNSEMLKASKFKESISACHDINVEQLSLGKTMPSLYGFKFSDDLHRERAEVN